MGQLSEPGSFASDDGAVPADVEVVLAARAAGTAGIREVVTCLQLHRVLVPLLEVAGDQLEGDDADPCAGTDRAVAAVSLRERDGTSLGLAFTGMAPLAQWDAAARPLPVESTRAAGAVLAEGGRALLVDPGTPRAVRIEGVALTRLASGEPWPEPWDDPVVRDAVVAELGPVLASGEIQVRLAGPAADQWVDAQEQAGAGGVEAPAAGLVLQVRFRPDLAADLRDQRAQVLAHRMGQSAALREVFDGVLAVQVVG